jgi:hypothetical protein
MGHISSFAYADDNIMGENIDIIKKIHKLY